MLPFIIRMEYLITKKERSSCLPDKYIVTVFDIIESVNHDDTRLSDHVYFDS